MQDCPRDAAESGLPIARIHGRAKNDFIAQVPDIITVGEFYGLAAGSQIMLSEQGAGKAAA